MSGLSDHREYIECKLSSLKKYTTHLDAVIAWVMETKTRINISKELPDKEKKRVIVINECNHKQKRILS